MTTDPNTLTPAHTVAGLRDEIAVLLTERGTSLSWAVQLALAEAYNYVDTTASPQPPPAGVVSLDPAETTAACVGRIRAAVLQLVEVRLHTNPGNAGVDAGVDDGVGQLAGVDPYALGHAAGQLGLALRELSEPRPA